MNTFDELMAAKVWTTGRPGSVAGTPQIVDERAAIEIALRHICEENGASKVDITSLVRPAYCKRPSFILNVANSNELDQMGWVFWFELPGPGISGFSFPLFVGDPTGVVATGDMI